MLLHWAARHGGALLAASILGGIALPPLAAATQGAVPPAVALLMLAALLLRLVPGPARLAGAGQALDGAVVLVLVLAVFAFGVMDGVQARLLAGNRNQALFLAVLPATADPGVLLFFAPGQIPMFCSPFLLRPAYRRLTDYSAA